MKPLSEWTEQELHEASDYDLTNLLSKYVINDFAAPLMNYAGTGNGMLEVIEAMNGQGFEVNMSGHNQAGYYVWFESKEIDKYTSHTSLPHAVAVAALLAIKAKT